MLRTSEHNPENGGVPTLAELIAREKAAHGLSYETLAALAGDTISRQRWQQLGTGARITEFPEPDTIRAIAAALKVDVALVVMATAKSIGLPVETGSETDLGMLLPYSARNLTIAQRNAILALIRAIVEPSPNNLEGDEPTIGGLIAHKDTTVHPRKNRQRG